MENKDSRDKSFLNDLEKVVPLTGLETAGGSADLEDNSGVCSGVY